MFIVVVSGKGETRQIPLDKEKMTLGRGEDNDIVLPGQEVSRRHALLVIRDGQILLEDLGSANGTLVNGKGVAKATLAEGDQMRIGSYHLSLRRGEGAPVSQGQGNGSGTAILGLKKKIHARLVEKMDLKRTAVEMADEGELRRKTREVVHVLLDEEKEGLPPTLDPAALAKEIVDEAIGLGPLEDLLADPEVTEIMVNGCDQVYVEKKGRLEKSSKRFLSDDHIKAVIERIVTPLGRRIDESAPAVDARLKDGSRVHAIIPPLSVKGPTLTIRKFSRVPYKVSDLVGLGSFTEGMARFFQLCVSARLNMVISGGTGSGKTTLLNVLSSFISPQERVVTIEDAAELRLSQEHVVSLESRPPNIEGRGAVTIRELVRNSLRMRPDRILVGECRGGEALDMLQAMNTGHDGSLTTVHANSPRDVLSRLETMALMAGMDLPLKAVREQIASAVHLIIHQARFQDGTRKVTHVTEVTGTEGDVITLQDIFLFQGAHVPTGFIPRFVERLRSQGVEVPMEIFQDVQRAR